MGTTESARSATAPGTALPLPPELVAERDRIRRLAADADRRARGGRFRRRALVPAVVASGVLASTGLISAWARATTPSPTAAVQPQPPATAASVVLSSEQAFLGQLRRTLSADQQAIAGLPQAAAGYFAAGAATTTGTAATTGAAGSTPAAAPAPLPALPSISIPAVSAAPPVHATTGASGIP